MPIDPVIREQMIDIITRVKKLQQEQERITQELTLWQGRVTLAREKGRPELAEQAEERVSTLQAKFAQVSTDIDFVNQERDVLRGQARRPSGVEVARAEAMAEQVRLGGLVDPDREDFEFDFGEEKE